MRLLASTDIALRVLMLLAREKPDAQVNVERMAHDLGGLSRNHLHKIVQELSALGVLRTQRGAGGGVALAKAADEIRLGALIRQLESDQAIVECFREDGGCCAIQPGCQLRFMLRTARDAFYRSLDEHTLANCLAKPGRFISAPRSASARKPVRR